MRLDRVFLDANVLFSAAYRKESGLLRLWGLPGTQLVTSVYAVDEARRNLADDEQQDRLNGLVESIEVTATAVVLPAGVDAIVPEKDRPILQGAVSAAATHLVTGDVRHFGPLFGQTVLGVKVLTPAAYLLDRVGGGTGEPAPGD